MKGNMGKSIAGNERQLIFDMAKGVGILLVIIGHMYDDYFDYPWFHFMHKVIYSFHMPLFFLISGYFIFKKNGKYEGKIKEKAIALFVPYFFVGGIKVLIIILHNLINGINITFAIDMIKMQNWDKFGKTALAALWGVLYGLGETQSTPFYINNVGALWYLPALFFASWIVLQLKDKKYVSIYIFFIALGGWVSSLLYSFRLPFSLQAGMVAAMYVYIGYLTNKKQLFNNRSARAKYFGGAIIIWMIVLFTPEEIRMSRVAYPYGPISFIAGIGGTLILFVICKWIENNKILSFSLSFLGRNTMILFCVDNLLTSVFPWHIVYDRVIGMNIPHEVIFILVAMFKTIIGIVFVLIVQKSSFLSRIFCSSRLSHNLNFQKIT